MVRCTDGSQMEVHPSYKFGYEKWNILPQAERDRITRERQEYQHTRQCTGGDDARSIISEITTAVGSISDTLTRMQAQISSLSQSRNNGNDSNSIPGTIMGGCNEQSSLRSRNTNGQL